MQSRFIPKWAGLVVVLGAAAAASSIYAQTWNYEGPMWHEAGGPTVPGQLMLEEVGGEYKLYMKQTNYSNCYKSSMRATVERTPSTITITTTPIIRGCPSNRFVLNTDGTSGVREYSTAGQWHRDEAFRLQK